MPTSSADPEKLEAAARAVPPHVHEALRRMPQQLATEIAHLNRAEQSPPLITLDPDLAPSLYRAVGAGGSFDTFLARVAAAFRTADAGDRPQSPVLGPPVLPTVNDSYLAESLAAWNACPNPVFRRQGERIEVRGPDGDWYVVRSQPPPGAVPLGPPHEQTLDLGNPEFGLALAAGATTLGAGGPVLRPAPPQSYDHVHFDDRGNLVLGGDAADPPLPPRSPVMGDPGPPGNKAAAAAEGLQGVLNGLGQYAAARYRNVFRTQTTYYVDPATGQRVAVVDAASIAYDGDDNAYVVSGRLTMGEDGRPTLVPTPPAPGEPCDPDPELHRRRIAAPEDD